MPYRDNPHHEIEIVMSFKNLNLFKSNEHTEEYHIGKQNDESLYSKLALKIIFMWEKI